MTKQQAIKKWVDGLSAISQEWVNIVAESKEEYPRLGMWGTCFILNQYDGEKFLNNSRLMFGDYQELKQDIEDNQDNYSESIKSQLLEAIEGQENETMSWGDCAILEDYIDEEMANERAILDKNGNTTGAFIHEVADEYILSINGAGFDFYDSIWPSLYDTLGLQWHDECLTCNSTGYISSSEKCLNCNN